MKVRLAKTQDAQKIAEINVYTWQNAYRGIIDDSILDELKADEKRISSWKKIIEDPNFIVLVCEDKEIMGYLCAGHARDNFGIKHEIYAFYVHPTAQRKGIGTQLLEMYKQIIKNEKFYLYALKQNKKAAYFYQKNGGVINENFNRNLTIKNQILEESCFVFA